MRQIFVSLLVSVLSFSALADGSSNPPPPPAPAPTPAAAEGHWLLIGRTCSSGVPPRDAFVLGRDQMKLSLVRGEYDWHTRILNCHYWGTGPYRLDNNSLTLLGGIAVSSCQHGGPAPSETFQVSTETPDHLKVSTSPMYGPGGSCPPGDVLQTDFSRD